MSVLKVRLVILRTLKLVMAISIFFNFDRTVPRDQKGLFELATQLRAFCYTAVCNTATGYVFLTDI
jgi:hypothetical protein